MSTQSLSFMLDSGLNLRDIVTTGSVLHINQDQDYEEPDTTSDKYKSDRGQVDILGQPVAEFSAITNLLVVDSEGHVKKKIIEEGGGFPLHEGCTVSIAFAGYWENSELPFVVEPLNKPMVVDLKENGLLPGLNTAILSMLVGEVSLFLLSYEVMYGEMGVPPKIKPKADCVFYIKLVKSTLTPSEGKINYSEPNQFERVHREVKKLYTSGTMLYKNNNYNVAVQLFKKSVSMLHRCRLADEKEEQIQEKLLKKLYINLVICYNKINKPLMACTACNELNRLRGLWNNGKVLFQNAKALRMIGGYDQAEKRLKRAMKLIPENEEMQAEYTLLMKTWNATKEAKLLAKRSKNMAILISDEFKKQIDELIRNFKLNNEEDEVILPSHFNSEEMAYLKQACIRENLFFSKFYQESATAEGVKESNEDSDEAQQDYVSVKRSFKANSKGSQIFCEIESDFV